MDSKSQKCNCSRRRAKELDNKRKERCQRLQETLKYNAKEESCYESRKDICSISSEYSSSIELPWMEIAINPTEFQQIKNSRETNEKIEAESKLELVRKESSGQMHLPWEDLMITNTVQSQKAKEDMDKCDSLMEIPWHDILFDPNIKLDDSKNDLKHCNENEVEIPWDDLLIPQNIVSLSKEKYCSRKRTIKLSNKKCGCSKSRT